jgi:hypothetical protein
MSRDEASRFRITTFPDVSVAPSEVTVPRLVGVLSAREALPPLPETFVALTPDEADIEVLFDERIAEEAVHGPGADEFVEQLQSLVRDLGYRRRTRDWPDWTMMLAFDWTDVERKPLPEEMFLRDLLGLDVDHARSVSRFLMEWGPLTSPSADGWRTDDVQFAETLRPPGGDYVEHQLTYGPGNKVVEDHEIHHQTHSQIVNAVSFPYRWVESIDIAIGSGEEDRRGFVVWTIRDQARQIKLFQALFESLAVLRFEMAGGVTGPSIKRLAKPWAQRELPPPVSVGDLLDTLAQNINTTLHGLGPRLEITEVSRGGESRWWQPVPHLNAALCLQALLFVSDAVPARQCANETCPQWFTRQQGRSKYGQRRTSGVLYCSASCAKAQAQRDYRRRQRRSGR